MINVGASQKKNPPSISDKDTGHVNRMLNVAEKHDVAAVFCAAR